MGFVATILGTMIVALSTWLLSRIWERLLVTVASAYGIACTAYWLPFLFHPNDQASSWQWLVINSYFKVGIIFGLYVLSVMQIIKIVGAKNHAH